MATADPDAFNLELEKCMVVYRYLRWRLAQSQDPSVQNELHLVAARIADAHADGVLRNLPQHKDDK